MSKVAYGGDDRCLHQRGDRWHYQRRVPRAFAHIDPRAYSKKALKTSSLEVARKRRDLIEQADDEWWMALAVQAAQTGGMNGDGASIPRAAAEQRYKAAVTRAMSYGFGYCSADVLAETKALVEILQRIEAIPTERLSPRSKYRRPAEAEAEALLGGAPDPAENVKVSEAFDLYIDEIAFDDQYNKSDAQKYSWKKTKRTSINYFIEEMGDIPLADITREKAIAYRNWWKERMRGIGIAKPVTPNTANRHIGNMRTLYEEYYKYMGKHDVENPFRGFFFHGKTYNKRPPFEDEWVRRKILVPGLFDKMRLELRVIVYVLIETGARISEICNLKPEDIRLEAEVPHIVIRPDRQKEVKAEKSERIIPLVGVALEAMKACPSGFPYYYDRSTLVSNNLNNAFKLRGLFPTEKHKVYSFRHSFEDRMLVASLDYGLRCALIGHKNTRPEYGVKGGLAFQRDQLLRIAHPFDPALFDGLLRAPCAA